MNALIRAAAGAAAILSGAVPATADTLSMPTVEYQATAKMMDKMTVSTRHAKGKMRVETDVPGSPQPMVGIIDLKAKKAITLITIPGGPRMAMELDFGEAEKQYGVLTGQGRRVGSDTVIGESCTLWEVQGSDFDKSGEPAVACVTEDWIPLRMQATVRGKRQTVMEVTELRRGPQDPKLFVVPSNVQVMKVPAGMIPGMGQRR